MIESTRRAMRQIGDNINLKVDNSEIEEMLAKHPNNSIPANEIDSMSGYELKGGSYDDSD